MISTTCRNYSSRTKEIILKEVLRMMLTSAVFCVVMRMLLFDGRNTEKLSMKLYFRCPNDASRPTVETCI